MQSTSQSTQASPHVSALEDRQIVQITVDNETNGREFEFADEILAKEIRVRGYIWFSTANVYNDYLQTRGCCEVQIEWLKITGVELDTNFSPKPTQSLKLPYEYQTFTTSNLALDIPVSLPSQTAMRKRFKVSVKWSNPTQSGMFPVGAETFRMVLLLEVTHDHIFR